MNRVLNVLVGIRRRQVIVHDDEWETRIAVNGHTYTADKRSGYVYHTPQPGDDAAVGGEEEGYERTEVGRWDPVQTLIVFNDAAAEGQRLSELGSASNSGGGAGLSDISPRSIAAAVRRKQKQKQEEESQAPQQGKRKGKAKGKSPRGRGGKDSSSPGKAASSSMGGRVASWAGPPQLILTEDEHDIIVEVLEEVYLADLVCAPHLHVDIHRTVVHSCGTLTVALTVALTAHCR
jgi:hypothetical protein